MEKVIIIGGGAAGMMAAVQLAQRQFDVLLLEKNEKLGKKLYITGKGRCNLTNDCDTEALFPAVMSNPRFLYSAFYGFDSRETMAFFEGLGLSLKTERGNRVFPVSDHSSDVIRCLERKMKELGVRISLHTEVKDILIRENRAAGVVLKSGEKKEADRVIVATGGLSYPSTGSTGDGYRFAVSAGHTLTETSPSLVPLLTKEDYIPALAGLSLKNCALTIRNGKKAVFQDFGELLFTHRGVSGPMILTASARIGKLIGTRTGEGVKKQEGSGKGEGLSAELDLKPALTAEQLDARILREFAEAPNRQFKNVIGKLFPASLTPVMIALSGIDPEKPVRQVTREERTSFGNLTKHFPFTITGKGSFSEAVITRGGVNVKEIDSRTMESRRTGGLFFIGEVLDLDAVTGGFNLQIAWSTAAAAARA